MQKRPSLFRSSPSVTVLGTLAICVLWSPVLLAFFNVSGPTAQPAQTAANAEFLRADGASDGNGVAAIEVGLTADEVDGVVATSNQAVVAHP